MEYAIWGIPKSDAEEQLLMTRHENKLIDDMTVAKKLKKILISNYGCTKVRIQTIDPKQCPSELWSGKKVQSNH